MITPEYEDVRGKDIPCALSHGDLAVVRVTLNAVNKKKFIFAVCFDCSIGIEATFRSFRKWSIRGGAMNKKGEYTR